MGSRVDEANVSSEKAQELFGRNLWFQKTPSFSGEQSGASMVWLRRPKETGNKGEDKAMLAHVNNSWYLSLLEGRRKSFL